MSYNSDLQDAINKINSITSNMNLISALEKYEKTYKPITQAAGMQKLINQAAAISALYENETSINNLIATSNSVIELAAAIQDPNLSQTSFSSSTLLAIEALRAVTSSISYEANSVRMSTDAQRILDSMPLSHDEIKTPSESLDNLVPEHKGNADVTSEKQIEVASKSILIPNKDFANKYSGKIILLILQIVLDVFVGCLTSDAPAIISAIEENTQRIETDFEKVIETINENHSEDVEIRNREIEAINEQNRLLKIIADSLAAPQSTSEHSEELPHPNGSENP